jgi:hypothetical protein
MSARYEFISAKDAYPAVAVDGVWINGDAAGDKVWQAEPEHWEGSYLVLGDPNGCALVVEGGSQELVVLAAEILEKANSLYEWEQQQARPIA